MVVASLVPRETAAKAVEALLKWIAAQTKHKTAQLLDHDVPIHVVVTLKKIPDKARTNPYLIPLPHSIHDINESAICLFVDDRKNAPVTPEVIKEQITKESIEVIGLSDLKADYVPYEARRKLCGSYELFFADMRIVPLLPRLIGKKFFRKKKHPLPLDVSRKNWKEQIKKGCGSTMFYVSTGSSCQLKVARLSMQQDMILDNVMKAIEGVIPLIPKGWAGVRSILVKSEDSIGLPLYQALPDVTLKIDVGKKLDAENSDGEVVQNGGEDVLDIEKKNDKKKKVKEIGSRKGKIHKIRYMDTNAEVETLLSDDDNNDGNDDNEEIVVEVKKKKKKDAKKDNIKEVVEKVKVLKKSEKLQKDVVAKKRKPKSIKSESKEDQGKKKMKKSKVEH
ncbi:Ribosomal L1 domain-containing protein [Zostera marina]|uniref:Ribosomal L1 domain-containing protein 1 n=1 Tax=Zostera marina TaxID=29655 RepID=A0A0K9PUN9_ZOSMR|nr:Ribosomal L1 domain-containing protein [Zostera marina]